MLKHWPLETHVYYCIAFYYQSHLLTVCGGAVIIPDITVWLYLPSNFSFNRSYLCVAHLYQPETSSGLWKPSITSQLMPLCSAK